jgi:hypothetical protein
MNANDYKAETVLGSVGHLLHRVFKNQPDGSQIEVPIRDDNSELRGFLTWASAHRPDLFLESTWENALPHPTFPNSVEEVVEYCKKHSTTLFVLPFGSRTLGTGTVHVDDGRRAVIRFTTQQHQNDYSFGMLQFSRLFEAVGHTSDAGIAARRLPFFVGDTLLNDLNAALSEEYSDVRRLSSQQVERTFVYVDIAKFSKHPVGRQLCIINSLIRVVRDKSLWLAGKEEPSSFTFGSLKALEASLCIGDGYIFVFKNAAKAAFFAAYLSDTIERLIADDRIVDFHFRMSINTGLVYTFWDPYHQDSSEAGRWNYVGQGITDGERVLTAIGKDKEDIIYVSAETRRKILSEYQNDRNSPYNATRWLQNRGRQADKHDVLRGLYEINHMGWMGELQEKHSETAKIDLWPKC